MKTSSLLIFSLLVVYSCIPTEYQSTTKLKSGILIDNMDTTINAGQDFNRYVNGTWIKDTEIPSDKSSYSISWILREQSEEYVKTIIEDASKSNKPNGSNEQIIGDFYNSYINMEARNKLGTTPLISELEKINQINNHNELIGYFAHCIKYGIKVPINLIVYPDLKNPKIYALDVWQGGLGLPDREYYLRKDDKSVEIRNKYMEHIDNMFMMTGLKNEESVGQLILHLETVLAEQHMSKEQTRNLEANYIMFPVDSLNEIMPKFNWNNFLATSELSHVDYLEVFMIDYLKSLDGIIFNTEIEDWKTYLRWQLIHANASYLTEEIVQENFTFYQKTLTGAKEQRLLWRRGVSVVNDYLGELVGKVYVDRHFPPEAKAKVDTIVTKIIQTYEMRIKKLDWMGEETKMAALDKLSKFTTKIGYPNKWNTYNIEIVPDNIYENIRQLKFEARKKLIAKVGNPVDKEEWSMTPQTVDAYYDPSKNEIVFSAAILQPPFFDINADPAVNYGGIGPVIGHEIGHGFDDIGSTFDGNGVMRNWWTDDDKEAFKERTSKLVAQYSGFKVFPDLNVNGEFTLGENIGDLGGLSIAIKAYQLYMKGKKTPIIDGFTGEQRVFIGYGQTWCGKSREEQVRLQIETNPHSPREFRVNGVVRNIPEFYTAFGVTESDSLYLAPEERVKIW
ncbi:MAG: M13 family metallopeptidase [Cyclobacteriaceae bacterium]|nr:M13 family metallopeptidase [Cyclobacteriaceae bacterium]